MELYFAAASDSLRTQCPPLTTANESILSKAIGYRGVGSGVSAAATAHGMGGAGGRVRGYSRSYANVSTPQNRSYATPQPGTSCQPATGSMSATLHTDTLASAVAASRGIHGEKGKSNLSLDLT